MESNVGSSTGKRSSDRPEVACSVDTALNPEAVAIETIPRDVGWLLLCGGLLTELGLPGVPPVWIFGLMIVWPRAGRVVSRTLQSHAPGAYRVGAAWLLRYVCDLEGRYPRPR